jgi:hypothetical protein
VVSTVKTNRDVLAETVEIETLDRDHVEIETLDRDHVEIETLDRDHAETETLDRDHVETNQDHKALDNVRDYF